LKFWIGRLLHLWRKPIFEDRFAIDGGEKFGWPFTKASHTRHDGEMDESYDDEKAEGLERNAHGQ
jgi:hypothetical protein